MRQTPKSNKTEKLKGKITLKKMKVRSIESLINPISKSETLEPIPKNENSILCNQNEKIQLNLPDYNALEEKTTSITEILQNVHEESKKSLFFLSEMSKFIASFSTSEELINTFRFIDLLFQAEAKDTPVFNPKSLHQKWQEKYGELSLIKLENIYNSLLRRKIKVMNKVNQIELTDLGLIIWKYVKIILSTETRKEHLGLLGGLFEAQHEYEQYLLFSNENIDSESILNYIVFLKKYLKNVTPKLYEIIGQQQSVKIAEKIKPMYEKITKTGTFKFLSMPDRDKVLQITLDALNFIYKLFGKEIPSYTYQSLQGEEIYVWSELENSLLEMGKLGKTRILYDSFLNDSKIQTIKIPSQLTGKNILNSFKQVLNKFYQDPDILPDHHLIEMQIDDLKNLPANQADALDLTKDDLMRLIPQNDSILESSVVFKKNLDKTMTRVFAVSSLIENEILDYNSLEAKEINKFHVKIFSEGEISRIHKMKRSEEHDKSF